MSPEGHTMFPEGHTMAPECHTMTADEHTQCGVLVKKSTRRTHEYHTMATRRRIEQANATR